MNITNILSFFLVVFASAMNSVFSSPLHRRSTPRWTHPCGEFEIQVPNPLPLPPLNETLGDIARLTKNGVDYSRQLQEKYRLKRIVSSDVADFLENIHMEQFPLKKTTDEAMTDAESDMVTVLRKDYNSLSKLAVWFEQVHLDEVIRHKSEFMDEVKRVEENIYAMLCKVDISLQILNSTVDVHVTRSAMPDKYRSMPKAQTYQRDFVINKDTSAFVDSLEIQYYAMEARSMTGQVV